MITAVIQLSQSKQKMTNREFETKLFVEKSVFAERLLNELQQYEGRVLNKEVIEEIIGVAFVEIQDDWDSSIASAIRTCLEVATRIHRNAENSINSHPYLRSTLKNGTSEIRMELAELANELGVDLRFEKDIDLS